MNEFHRIFARFHLGAGIGDAVVEPVDILECRNRTIREENASKPSLQRRLNETGFADERAPNLPLLED